MYMTSARYIAVLVLSTVLVLCTPLHIFSLFRDAVHTPTHHASHTAEHSITSLFAHANEMTSAPWITMLTIILGALIFWFRTEYLLNLYRIHSPTPQTFFNTVFTDSGGVFRWIKLHHTSPPHRTHTLGAFHRCSARLFLQSRFTTL
jgi:hypothetical protein